MQVDLIQIIVVTGGWSGALMGLATYLHTRRAGQMQKLADRIEAAEGRASRDHRALAAQITDTNQTIREHYVRRTDLTHDLDDIKKDIGQVSGGIAAIQQRVDQLFQSVEWRKGTRG